MEKFSEKPALLFELITSVIHEKPFYQNASRFKDILGSTYDAGNTAVDILISS